ncbi:MAG: alpha-L-fucosidase [Ruminococcaceae bacterium]|nr:alpha-L-fucosidase [Oscillospiraceae bacterium]
MADKLQWFREAKYGLFIHWGLYAIPGGIWEGKSAPHGTEWIMKNMKIPLAHYKKLVGQFNPEGFDPYFYVRQAKKWGMKYIVFTAKHHDGFAMYDTKVSEYSIMHTPYGKDIVRQLADACEAEGMTLCIYYSQMQDWEHPDGNGNTWDYDPQKQDFKRYFYQKALPQVRELLTNYGKIGMMWFDTPYDMPLDLCRELADEVRKCQPDCLINGRIGYGLGDFREAADNAIPVLSQEECWESPMTLNSSWGYSHTDHRFKEPAEVIRNLVRIVGKGGNLVLNVGPDAFGRIPPRSNEILCEVGEWLEQNGESIFGTSAAPNFPYLLPWGDLTYNDRSNTLYLHVQNYPSFPYRILLTGLKTKTLAVNVLGEQEPLRISQSYEIARDEHRLYILLPEQCPSAVDTVVKVQLAGSAEAQVIGTAKW